MSFEQWTEIMFEWLLKAIRCADPELLGAKVVVDQQFPRNFIGACGYFSQQVAQVHGPAQLEYCQARATFPPSIVKQFAAAVDEAAMVAEDNTTDGEDKAKAAGVPEAPILMVSMSATQTVVLLAESGRL
jgi:hypothetical protein